ncbi:MAG: hypothetical protein PHE18_02305 [Candidatus Omnitrophica bacterium]|nr:hypothetical protein [Candidatus Omnitrophota bacterium]MDD5552685.1 hypothetical protein [Candidatus Omnitrophota bacterium]
MKDNASPEERLLKLIRGEKKQGPALDRPKANKFIPFILPAVSAILIFALVLPRFFPKKTDLAVEERKEDAEALPPAGEEARPYEYYAQGPARDIFGAPASDPSAASAVKGEAQSFNDITLIGIIGGESPQAVIEDKKSQKTYTLSEGQFLGDFQVEKILEGKVILISNGRRYELNI